MIQRPESHGEQYVVHFQDQSVVDRYHLRPTYPPETFKILDVNQPVPWSEGYRQIGQRFTNNPTYVPFDWIAELEKYQLFQKLGERKTEVVSVQQTVADTYGR